MAKKDFGIPSLKEVVQEGLRPQLEHEVQRMAKIINQRFYRMEKSNLQKGSYAYKQAIIETGLDKPRYVTNKNKIAQTPLSVLYRQYMELYVKEHSATSLISGVRRINEKRISNAVDKLQSVLGREINKEEFKQFIEYGGGEIINHKYLDSEQIVEDWLNATKDGNITVKEFIREFKRFRVKKIEYGRVTENLERLRRRKEKRKNDRS